MEVREKREDAYGSRYSGARKKEDVISEEEVVDERTLPAQPETNVAPVVIRSDQVRENLAAKDEEIRRQGAALSEATSSPYRRGSPTVEVQVEVNPGDGIHYTVNPPGRKGKRSEGITNVGPTNIIKSLGNVKLYHHVSRAGDRAMHVMGDFLRNKAMAGDGAARDEGSLLRGDDGGKGITDTINKNTGDNLVDSLAEADGAEIRRSSRTIALRNQGNEGGLPADRHGRAFKDRSDSRQSDMADRSPVGFVETGSGAVKTRRFVISQGFDAVANFINNDRASDGGCHGGRDPNREGEGRRRAGAELHLEVKNSMKRSEEEGSISGIAKCFLRMVAAVWKNLAKAIESMQKYK